MNETTHIGISIGLLISLAGTLVWVGRQAQRIDQLEKSHDYQDASLENFKRSVESKLDRIWEFLIGRRSDSKPPP